MHFERPNAKGNNYNMAIVGTLTKWAEALPMQDEIAETVAKIFVGKVVCRFDFPAQLHSDQ